MVPGWSIEETREKPNIAVEEDAEEVKWRGLSQSEMDQYWNMLAERMEEEVLDKYNKVEESKRAPWNGGEYEETRDSGLGNGEKIAGHKFAP